MSKVNVFRWKSWPAEFRAVKAGAKSFEIRRDDRDPRPAVGDLFLLEEWAPVVLSVENKEGHYTGDFAGPFRITYVERSKCLPPGWFGFSFELDERTSLQELAAALAAKEDPR